MSKDGTLRRQHRFTVTPEHLILDPRVDDRAFRLWCRLDRFVGANEVAFPSRETLAIELDCSPSSIDRSLRQLVAAHWLEKELREGDTNNYVLIVAPEKEVERLVTEARKERIAATEGRREKKREVRRAAKKQARTKNSSNDENAQVNAGGVTTGGEPPEIGGVITGDEPPVITGDEPGVITGGDHKEATPEGSNTEGSSDPSLRSGSGAVGQPTLDGVPAEPAADSVLTEQETETGRDAAGKPLRGKKLDALTQSVATTWWEWIDTQGHSKPAQSFIACRQIIRAALGNGIAPKQVKIGLAKITVEGRAVSGASLQIAMQDQSNPGMRRGGYDDVATWGDRTTPTEQDAQQAVDHAAAIRARGQQPPQTGTAG